MRKHIAVLFIAAAALSVAGVAGAQSPDPTDGIPDTTETTVPADGEPEGEPVEEEPTTTESTNTTSTTAPPESTTTTAAPVVELGPSSQVLGVQQESCDPNYVGACVPISVADLNCGDVVGNDFRSVGSDPHNLDGNNDGWACESPNRSGSTTAVSVTSSGAPGALAATGSSSEQRYLLALGLLVAGVVAVLASAALAPAIIVPRRGGFTVTKVNGSGDEIRMRVIGERAGRRHRR